MNDDKVQIVLKPSTVSRVLAVIALFLVVMSILTKVLWSISGEPWYFGWVVTVFGVNQEKSIPTVFSVAILLLASALTAIIAMFKIKHSAPYRRHWVLLALVFLLLAVDEGAAIHEHWIGPLRNLLNTGGVLYYAWIIPALFFVVVFAAAFFAFWLHLPRRTRILLFVSAALFVSGAIGMEMFGGVLESRQLTLSWLYHMATHIEESLEMGGIILMIFTLLDYLKKNYSGFEIRFEW